jgi:hypothetical protein
LQLDDKALNDEDNEHKVEELRIIDIGGLMNINVNIPYTNKISNK